MRIVGGKFRGRTLKTPHSDTIRPTSDRLRQAIFNILEHNYKDVLHHARVLDLFAGTGACGLEALSRGAAFAAFIDKGHEAQKIIHENIDTFGVSDQTVVIRLDATALKPLTHFAPFSLVFCDPPYGKSLSRKALTSCAQKGWLAPNALILVEEETGEHDLLPETDFTLLDTRIYGSTHFIFSRYQFLS